MIRIKQQRDIGVKRRSVGTTFFFNSFPASQLVYAVSHILLLMPIVAITTGCGGGTYTGNPTGNGTTTGTSDQDLYNANPTSEQSSASAIESVVTSVCTLAETCFSAQNSAITVATCQESLVGISGFKPQFTAFADSNSTSAIASIDDTIAGIYAAETAGIVTVDSTALTSCQTEIAVLSCANLVSTAGFDFASPDYANIPMVLSLTTNCGSIYSLVTQF